MLLLIASFGALSGLYMLLDAPFVAVTQIIVYAGAIMVLFLFVVMLLNAPQRGRRASGTARIRCCGPAAMRVRRAAGGAAGRRAGLGAVASAIGAAVGARGDAAAVSSVARASAACCSPTTRSRSR